jgi:trehalose 6-phosphate synthase
MIDGTPPRERRALIVVSNRGPVGYARDADGGRVRLRGAGGLVTALRPLVSRHDVTWIASALSDEDAAVAAAGPVDEVAADGSTFRLRLVAHGAEDFRSFYEVMANPVLWFVQHGLWGLRQGAEQPLDEAWAAYEAVNETFARAVVDELARAPAAIVLFQDYHLYRAPMAVRSRVHEARLAHFVHIPWPDPEAWRVLPRAVVASVHEGLLANDSIGFHAERWRTAFCDACEAFLGRGADARRASHVNPIAVDAAEFDLLARSDAVARARDELVEERPDVLVLRVDRTDPAKNAVRGFEAFGRLLVRRPDLHGRVQLLALLDPSRQTIPEYVAYRDALQAAADEVNAAHRSTGWLPVDVRVRDDFAGSVAAYMEYDVLLVNPVRDGLNLVAKEAPLVNRRSGVVVLSRDAGAWEELAEWVIGIDPLDVEATSDALERAIALPEAERVRRQQGIVARVRAHDLFAWADIELAAVEARSTMRR